ncbi:MAG: dCTP deaminase [bacterium]
MFYSKEKIIESINSGRIKITPFDQAQLGLVSYELHLGANVNLISPKAGNVFHGDEPKKKIIKQIAISEKGYQLLPGEFIIAETNELISLDNKLMAIFDGKASLAQIGLFTNVSSTLVEPLTNKRITCEVFNCSKFPIILYKGQKIGQIYFSDII